jgi:hypothetical protein
MDVLIEIRIEKGICCSCLWQQIPELLFMAHIVRHISRVQGEALPLAGFQRAEPFGLTTPEFVHNRTFVLNSWFAGFGGRGVLEKG